jgi:diadenylate cyclase
LPLFDFIPSPTWRDLADILFLTLVTYQLYVWFRGTRALRVLIGLVVLGGIYSLAKLWGLFLTTWAFQFLWQVLLILLLILFQSEIRQVLEKVSPLRYLRSRKRVSRGTLARELAEVAFEMAQEQTGALVVLSRDDNPSEFLHAGQTIMALPEPTLIKSIFNHHAPAHDGALVLSQGRLTQMGCILPLSEREDIPEHYGTRHRAAVGLSERTDVICLVVSEERAEVSTVVGGKIKIWDNSKQLSSQLEEWLSVSEIPGPTIKGFIHGAFVENWGPKLIALALVSLAWLILASPQQVKVNVTAPIRYVNIPSELSLGEESAKTVRLTLSGRRHSIRVLGDNEVRVQLGLGKRAAGTHLIKLSARNIDLPLGVTIDRVTPQNIKVILTPSSGDPNVDKGVVPGD